MTKRICKPRKFTIDVLNKILEDNLQKLRITKLQTGDLHLNNGKIITDQSALVIFKRRVLSKVHIKFMDKLYSLDTVEYDNAIKDIRQELIKCKSAGGHTTWKKYKKLGMVEWIKVNGSPIKGKKIKTKHWAKGKTKLTDERLSKMSKNMIGEKNHRFSIKWSQEYKEQSSLRMKNKILNNEFTPNSNNRQTHFECSFNGKKYRSSWEAAYHSLNVDDEYEKLRIQYNYENSTKIYIVDFVNHLRKYVVEVKPLDMFMNCNKTKTKIEALKNWCNDNNYELIMYTEIDIFNNRDKLVFEKFDEITAKKIKKVIYNYENSKAHKDRKTE